MSTSSDGLIWSLCLIAILISQLSLTSSYEIPGGKLGGEFCLSYSTLFNFRRRNGGRSSDTAGKSDKYGPTRLSNERAGWSSSSWAKGSKHLLIYTDKLFQRGVEVVVPYRIYLPRKLYRNFAVLASIKPADHLGGYLFAVLNAFDTVVDLGVLLQPAGTSQTNISLLYTDSLTHSSSQVTMVDDFQPVANAI